MVTQHIYPVQGMELEIILLDNIITVFFKHSQAHPTCTLCRRQFIANYNILLVDINSGNTFTVH